MRRACIVLLASGSVAFAAGAATAPPAQANLLCGAAGLVSGLAGKACGVVTGPVGGLVKKVLGGGSSSPGSSVARAAGLRRASARGRSEARTPRWTSSRRRSATRPLRSLTSTWFSGDLLASDRNRRAARAAVPVRGRRAGADAIGPVAARPGRVRVPAAAVLATAIAAPLTMLLLAGSDEMSSIVSSAGPRRPPRFSIADTLRVTGGPGSAASVKGAPGPPALLIALGDARGRVAPSRAVARARPPRGGGVRDRPDAPARIRGDGLAGAPGVGAAGGRGADRADPVEGRDRRRAHARGSARSDHIGVVVGDRRDRAADAGGVQPVDAASPAADGTSSRAARAAGVARRASRLAVSHGATGAKTIGRRPG